MVLHQGHHRNVTRKKHTKTTERNQFLKYNRLILQSNVKSELKSEAIRDLSLGNVTRIAVTAVMIHDRASPLEVNLSLSDEISPPHRRCFATIF